MSAPSFIPRHKKTTRGPDIGNVDRSSFTPDQLKELDRLERRETVKAAAVKVRGNLEPIIYLAGASLALSLAHVEFQYVLGAYLILRGVPAFVLTLREKH